MGYKYKTMNSSPTSERYSPQPMSTEVGWTHPPVPSALWGQRKEEGEGYS
jgi:hypothetical protein